MSLPLSLPPRLSPSLTRSLSTGEGRRNGGGAREGRARGADLDEDGDVEMDNVTVLDCPRTLLGP